MKDLTPKKIFLAFFLLLGLLIFPFHHHSQIFASSPAHPSSPIMLQTDCGDISVELTPSTATYDEDIDVSINIADNQCQMSAFGFDLFYDTTMFSYQGIEVLNCLTADWGTVDADEVSPGQVRIGGFAGSGTLIEPSDDGSVVIVKLKVACQCPACSDGQQSTITIDAYTDELSAYDPEPATATFTLICCCGDISLPTAKSGTWGDIVYFPVNIVDNDNQVCDFAFDFVFDPSALELKQVLRTVATQNWSTLNFNQTSPGRIHIDGASGSGTCISPQSDVNLVRVKMMVKCAGYASDTPIPISIESYQYGISCMCPRSFEADFLYRACPRLGDVSGDGTVTPGDAQKAFDIYLGRLTPTANQLTISDANCSCPCNSLEHSAQNNCTTPGDAQWIFEHYLGRRTLPLCCANYQCQTTAVQLRREPGFSFIENREVFALPAIAYSGEKVMIPVMVDNPDQIRFFTLEMFYPQDLLEFEGLLPSPLTKGFDFVNGAENYPGVISIEGQGQRGITCNDPGSLCVAVFRARKEASGNAPIVLNSLSGEIRSSDADARVFVRPKPAQDQGISVSLGRGTEQGDTLVVPVHVTDAIGLKAFGLEISYTPDKMTFVGVQRTNLTENFVAVDGNDVGEGLLRIGGYAMNGIQDFDNGALVDLIFQVNEPGGEIEITDTCDDLKKSDSSLDLRFRPKR